MNGGNAFVSGVTDRANGESIRFGAGKPYGEKYLSPFQVLDNGLVRFVNPLNGQTTFEIGYNQYTGKVVWDIYGEDGSKTATIGPRGIMFTGFVAESYTQFNMVKAATTLFDPEQIKSEITPKLTKYGETSGGRLS